MTGRNATSCSAPMGQRSCDRWAKQSSRPSIAARSAGVLYGPTRVAAGIVGGADLTLGDRVESVL